MGKQMNGGKFGLEIPALTEARNLAAADSYSQKNILNIIEKNSELIRSVVEFLEKNGAYPASACGSDYMFGVITYAKEANAPCGVTFYGSKDLAQSLANAFPAHKVIAAHDGEVITPAAASMPRQTKPRPAQRPRF